MADEVKINPGEGLTWGQVLTRSAGIIALVISMLGVYDRVYRVGVDKTVVSRTLDSNTAALADLKSTVQVLYSDNAEQKIWIRNRDSETVERRGEIDGNFGQLNAAISAMTAAVSDLTSNAKQVEYRLSRVEANDEKQDTIMDALRDVIADIQASQLVVEVQLDRIEDAVTGTTDRSDNRRLGHTKARRDGSISIEGR